MSIFIILEHKCKIRKKSNNQHFESFRTWDEIISNTTFPNFRFKTQWKHRAVSGGLDRANR